jgi:hypothetical protein
LKLSGEDFGESLNCTCAQTIAKCETLRSASRAAAIGIQPPRFAWSSKIVLPAEMLSITKTFWHEKPAAHPSVTFNV